MLVYMKLPLTILLLFFQLAHAKSDSTENDLFTKGLTYYSQKNYPECIQTFLQLNKINPEKAIYPFNLGNCALMSEKYELAIKAYQKIISINKNFIEPAKLNLAITYIKISKHKEAYEILEKLSQSPLQGIALSANNYLDKLDAQEELESKAFESFQNDQIPEAINLLQNPKAETLSIDAEILYSLCLIKTNNYAEAQSHLDKILKTPLLSKENRTDAQNLLKKLKTDANDKKLFWGFLDFSFGNASNIYLDGKSTTPVSCSTNKYTLGLGYQKNFLADYYLKISYQFSKENYSQASDLDTANNYVQGTLSLESNTWDVSLNSYVQNELWTNQEVSQRLGSNFKANYATNNYDAGFSGDYFYQKSLSSSYSYLSGATTKFKGYMGLWSDKTYYQLNYEYTSDGTQDITYTDGSRLPLNNIGSGPGFKIFHRFSKELAGFWNINYFSKKYKNVALPDNKLRSDTEIDTSIKLSYSLFTNFQIYIYANYLSNSSSLGSSSIKDKNYDSTSYYLGFNWDFL